VRQARYRGYAATVGGPVEPDPVTLATLSERAGADGITIHLREDRRHIQERDVYRLREVAQTRINLEMACTPAMTEFALKVKPESVCLVPESREEISTEGGLDVVGQRERVRAVCEAMRAAGIIVSLFIDADAAQIDASAELKAPWIELHTGSWANAFHTPKREEEFARLVAGARRAHAAGLVVNAGHGINYINVSEVRTLPHVHELNIGHSIISRALFTGIEEAVREMKARMNP
jgi:pyridoxine 5-phosphate synthase